MSSEEKILVNVTPSETRVAWVANGVLQEVWIERSNKRGLVGNIYLGKVERVLPGMQAAFVNIGLERAAFLHLSDVCLKGVSEAEDSCEDIQRLLRPGQKIMVQVVKDPLGAKGARVTMHVTIPSRLLVFLPNERVLGVSQKIECEEERQRLRTLTQSVPEYDEQFGGVIVRTVAEGCDLYELRADMLYLQRLWQTISDQTQHCEQACLIYEDLPLFLRILRDVSIEKVEEIQVDSTETYQKMQRFVEQYILELKNKISLYKGDRPIFDLYSIEEEIQAALQKRVNLKSGGYLIIDQTEAMTTIDVNTGAFVGHKNLEETIYRTNLEAAQAIARQLRLRNLGGIIILDFIDMVVPQHREQVLLALEKALQKDRVKTSISEISRLGLVEMTRKRTRESLENTLCEPCVVCNGRGTTKTSETMAYEIFREITRMAKSFDAQTYRVIASEPVVSYILDEESTAVAELEAFLDKSIRFQAESGYTAEQYDVVMM